MPSSGEQVGSKVTYKLTCESMEPNPSKEVQHKMAVQTPFTHVTTAPLFARGATTHFKKIQRMRHLPIYFTGKQLV
jgi:hypothetical protein